MPTNSNSSDNFAENPFNVDRIKIEFLVNPEDPHLLDGLDYLLELGLISDDQMRQIARRSLKSQRRIPQVVAAVTTPVTLERESVDRPINLSQTPPKARLEPSRPSLLTAFMGEISVVWLLFLGVFLVVGSSACLAAIQWRNFSAVGQYGILLAYTLVFGAAGLWASARDSLKITGRMLQIATLLIIPVNFWMMDGFRLWANPIGWVMIAIATVALGGLQWKLLAGASNQNRWNSFLLNGLHWGWSIAIVPVLFTYIGTIMTAFVQSIAQRSRNAEEEASQPLSVISIVFAAFLLVGRAILVKGVPISRFGLAIAIVGWLLYWINRKLPQNLWLQVGAALLGIGWLVSYIPDPALLVIRIDPLWQTLGISGLAIWVLSHRLHKAWERPVLLGLWVIGLQTYTLLRVLIPPSARQTLMTLIADWANLRSGAWELTGLGFFSYVILSLIFAAYLNRKQQAGLANLTEQLTLILGLGLVVPSLYNPLIRAIYFSLCAIVLSVLWLQRRLGKTSENILGNLVYLAHTTTGVAIVSWILWLFPKLSTQQWAWILLAGALLEWGFAALSRDRFWQNSAWLLGLAQATCAYPLLLDNLQMDGHHAYAGLPWLLVPIALTGLAYVSNFAYGSIAVRLSTGSLILALVITFTSLNPFLATLFVATAVMFANTARSRQAILAFITVGHGLLWLGLQSWSLLDKPEPKWYLVGVAIAIWIAWIARDLVVRWATHHDSEELSLPHLYYEATNAWGRGLALVMGLVLGAIVLLGFLIVNSGLPWQELCLAGVLTFIAIAYRVWQEPTDLGLWGLAIGAEILVNLVAEWIGAPLNYRVIVTLLLGMGTQLIGDWWASRNLDNRDRTAWTAFNGVPICYAVLTFLIAHTAFSNLTGLYTIGLSLILIMVGRRADWLKTLSYLGLVGVSLGAYEYVFYQLSQASGGSTGDGLVIISIASALLALLYQALGDRIAPLIRITPSSLQATSSIHWGIGSFLGLMAIPAGLSDLGEWLWILAGTGLTINALWQGRGRSLWIYPGFWQLVLTLGFLLDKLLPTILMEQWGALIASIFAYGVFVTSWTALGWQLKPWHQSATALPIAIVLLTASTINTPCILLTAAFYGLYAWRTEQIRLSYFGVLLTVWGLFKWLIDLAVTEPLWYAATLCMAVLFIAEIEPTLQVNSARNTRHLIRCFALGLFAVTLFYDPWNIVWLRGVVTIGVSLGIILMGLVRRTRAYLYIGTTTFVLGVLRMLWLFISDYSLLLWAVGIALGLVLIWIAATFESRRSQTIAFVEYWLQELDEWE